MKIEFACLKVGDLRTESLVGLAREIAHGHLELWNLGSDVLEALLNVLDELGEFARSPDLESLLKKSFSRAMYNPPDPTVPVVDCQGLDQAYRELVLPAAIVVENGRHDGAFLRALANVLGRSDLIDALESGRASVVHGGGSTTKQVIEDEIEARPPLGRVVCFVDSDRLSGTEEAQSARVVEAARIRGVVVHVLKLREAENYLPNRVLGTIEPRRHSSRKLDALKRLSLSQRGYFDMKAGFQAAKRHPDRKKRQDLLFGERLNDCPALENGFGDGLLVRFHLMSDHVSVSDFDSLGVTDELNELCDTIEGVL